MEPLGLARALKTRPQAWAATVLSAIGLALVVFPLVAFVKSSFLSFEVSGLFVRLLGRALVFTTLQSLLSAATTLLLAAPFGLALGLGEGRLARRARAVADAVGSLVFAFPGVLVSLVVLTLADVVPGLPSLGLAGVVWAHVLIHVLFVSAAIGRSVRGFVQHEGADLLAAATLLGASPGRARHAALWPVIRHEIRTWAPLVFLWSFSAFSTVVIIGGGPQASSPEVLLYFALQSDPDPGRLVLLAIAQLGLGLALARLALAADRDREGLALVTDDLGRSSQPEATRIPAAWSWAGLALVAAALSPLLRSPLSVLLARTPPPDGFWPAVAASALVAVAAVAAALGAFRLLLAAGRSARWLAFAASGVSAVLIAAFWIAAGFDLWFESPWSQGILAAAGVALSYFPFMAYWIERDLGRFPDTQIEAACTLGAGPGETWARVVGPQLRPTRARIAAVVALGALGDLAFSTLFLRDTETLAVLSRRLAARYDFSGSDWVLLAMFAASLATWAAFTNHRRRTSA